MKLWHVFAGCLVLALAPALLIGMIALDHNPQEEFQSYETGAYTADFYILVGVWWIVFASPVFGAAALYKTIERFRRS